MEDSRAARNDLEITDKHVHAEEAKTIAAGRTAVDGSGQSAPNACFFGLALSGGGIRSATFGLGVLQAMAEKGLLRRVDYLSTVSGGGYIGGWFSALLHRRAEEAAGASGTPAGPEQVAAALQQMEGQSDLTAIGDREGPAITHLRRYSSYLTPRAAVFSLDTLGALASLFRNLLLNQSILICLLAALLLFPAIVALGFEPRRIDDGRSALIWSFAAAMLLWAAHTIARALKMLDHGRSASSRRGILQRDVVSSVALPSFLAALSVSWLLSMDAAAFAENDAAPFWVTVGYVAIWFLGWLTAPTGRRADEPRADRNDTDDRRVQYGFFLGSAIVAGASLAAMLLGYAKALTCVAPAFVAWFSIGLGTAIIWGMVCLAVIIHIGVGKRLFSEMGREWLGRAGGVVLAGLIGWSALCIAALYSWPLVAYCRELVAYVGAAWLLHTLAGVWLAHSPKTGTGKLKKNAVAEVVAQSMPYVFIGGLLVALSAGIHEGLVGYGRPPCGGTIGGTAPHDEAVRCVVEQPPPCPPSFLSNVEVAHRQWLAVASEHFPSVLAAFLGLGVIGLFMAWRVDINLFSMHQFYRNRLTRCYLGASNRRRKADMFTDLDANDDVPLAKLAQQRPVHLINTALNLTRVCGPQECDEDRNRVNTLAWQERLSGSFVFAPQYSGFQLPGSPGVFQRTSHCMTSEGSGRNRPEGTGLGTAIAVSGAAVSPNMGYHSSPALSFVMTFFNVRLGRWCGNPRNLGAWKRSSPRLGLKYLLAELFGAADTTLPFVNLSDGGHFENLGVYELVRRQCRLIVVSDAGQDQDFQFEDLGNAVRKCRVDLGVDIRIDLSRLTEKDPARRARVAVGQIIYPDRQPAVLVYLKPLLCSDEPTDVSHYACTHPDFPHQSTDDQWFNEAQFESYRQLGLITGLEVFGRHYWGDHGAATCEDWVSETIRLLHNSLPTELKGETS